MNPGEHIVPIIRSNVRLDEYPFEAIHFGVLEVLREAAASNAHLNEGNPIKIQRMLKLVEAVLRVVGREMRSVVDSSFETTCQLVVGALASPRFLEATAARRSDFVGLFRNCIRSLAASEPGVRMTSELFTNQTRALASDVAVHREAFERMHLVDEQVWLWSGWHATSSSNVAVTLPLYSIYRTLGRQFTSSLHEAVRIYVGTRSAGVAPLIKELASFIGDFPHSMPHELRACVPGKLTPALLLDRGFADRFWRGFLIWHVSSAFAAGSRLTTISAKWNGQFIPFISESLRPLGIFEVPPAGMPRLDGKTVPGERRNVRVGLDGREYRSKLLTDVPIQTTDDQALRLLVADIKSDLDLIVQWSKAEVEETNNRIAARNTLAGEGTVRHIQPIGTNDSGHKWLCDPSNPAWLANAAATFAHYGYLTDKDVDISQLYRPVAAVARQLGLPASDVLNPYLNLLVADHPAITPSFLRTLELFDKHGVRTGFTDGDQGAMLHGIKSRRGPDFAAQDIVLTSAGRELVMQIIEVTHPLREYLREHGDSHWRRLLLSSAQGFGYPKPFRTDPIIPGRLERNASRLAKTCGVSEHRARELLKRCRLPAIRASKAVLVYVETGSVHAMANALGHAKYEESLISHYLPKSISDFFRERWIRLFQTGIILEALKGSPYRFRACAFNNAQEMNEFLEHHPIKTIEIDQLGELAADSSKVVFGLDVEVLTLLTSLCSAVESAQEEVCPIALHWTKIAHKLFAYIQSAQCLRDDIRAYLVQAKSNADITMVARVLYA